MEKYLTTQRVTTGWVGVMNEVSGVCDLRAAKWTTLKLPTLISSNSSSHENHKVAMAKNQVTNLKWQNELLREWDTKKPTDIVSPLASLPSTTGPVQKSHDYHCLNWTIGVIGDVNAGLLGCHLILWQWSQTPPSLEPWGGGSVLILAPGALSRECIPLRMIL